MNEPRPVPPQGQQGLSPGSPGVGQASPHLPRPAGAPIRSPVAPPPAQRLPGQPGHAGAPSQSIRSSPPPPMPVAKAGGSLPLDGDDELINLEDDDAAAAAPGAAGNAHAGVPIGQLSPASKIKVHGGGDKHTYTRFKRNAHVAGSGACRVRSFHGRLSDDGLAFMDDKINEWLDNHPEIEVKLVNCVVGPLEGKVTGEQALFVTVWY